MTQKASETAMGMGSYSGSPAAAEDRRLGIKVGGIVEWLAHEPSEPDKKIAARITKIAIDADGDPWFDLEILNDEDHKPVREERSGIAPWRGHCQWSVAAD